MSIDWGVVLGWINWGLVVNALAAAGSVSAAVVALHIATRDRRERQHERDEAAKAQARLVIVKSYGWVNRGEKVPEIALICDNHSDRPILDVKPDQAWIPGFPAFSNIIGEDRTWTLLKPDDECRFSFVLADGAGTSGPSILPDDALAGSTIDYLPIVGAVTFIDAGGSRWRKFNNGDVERVDQGA